MGRSYKDLVAWQRAMDLVTATYKATAGFPRDELFGLTSQFRRAAVSIPSNIAEGQGRLSEKEPGIFVDKREVLSWNWKLRCKLPRILQKEQIAPLLQSCAEVGRILNG